MAKQTMEATLLTRFSLKSPLRELPFDWKDNHFNEPNECGWTNDFGTLKLYFYSDENSLHQKDCRVTLITSNNTYVLNIKDNLIYDELSSENYKDSIVIDDDKLLLSQKYLNGARMSFVYNTCILRESKNADHCILAFNSKEDTAERSLLTIIQVICSYFGDIDSTILDFFIAFANSFFAGNSSKPGVDFNKYTGCNSAYQKIAWYLRKLYKEQCLFSS